MVLESHTRSIRISLILRAQVQNQLLVRWLASYSRDCPPDLPSSEAYSFVFFKLLLDSYMKFGHPKFTWSSIPGDLSHPCGWPLVDNPLAPPPSLQAASRTPLRTTSGSTTCWAWGLCARTSTCGTARPPAPSATRSAPSSSSARPSSSSGGVPGRRSSSSSPSCGSHSSQVGRRLTPSS